MSKPIIMDALIEGYLSYLDKVGRKTPRTIIDVRCTLRRAIEGLAQIPALKIYGITDPSCFDWRCPTLAVRVIDQTADQTPLVLATKLGDQGFFTWDGNYYALNLTEHLDVEKSGGFLRIGLVHYNTADEVDRLLAALKEIVGK